MAVTKYFAVYNNDDVITVDDTYKNLMYHHAFGVKTYKRYYQASQFQSADTNVYQYHSSDNDWHVFIAFDVSDQTDQIFSNYNYYNTVLSFRPPPSSDVLYFCYRTKDKYYIFITVPNNSPYGKSEATLQDFLAKITYVQYAEYEIEKNHGSGLLVCNANREAIFSSSNRYMTVQKYFFKCIDKITDAKKEFGTVTIDCDYDIEIAPFTAHQYVLYTLQRLLHYRTYIKLTSKRTVECQIELYDNIPNAEYAIGGPMGITTSFMLLKKIV